jgi:hypothetical protein
MINKGCWASQKKILSFFSFKIGAAILHGLVSTVGCSKNNTRLYRGKKE